MTDKMELDLIDALAELHKIEALNRDLLEALEAMLEHDIGHGDICDACVTALAAISKAKEES